MIFLERQKIYLFHTNSCRMIIPEFKLERYMALHEFSAPYLLCTSDCESMTIQDILDLKPEYADEFKKFRLSYTESQGSPKLRTAIASLYENRRPETIIVTAGAEEAIFISMQVLLKEGDHAIIQTPAYQSLKELPMIAGSSISSWEMVLSDGEWGVDFDNLISLINDNTKLIVVNSPHNPTGYQFSKDQWKKLIEIAKLHSIRILSDEVYRGMERNIEDKLFPMADLMPDGISIGVMSKAFGLAGLRIGWIATDDKSFRDKFLAFKDYTTICSSGPSEFLSICAIENSELIFAKNKKIIEENLIVINEFFSKWKKVFEWKEPISGTTTFPKVITGVSSEEFCDNVRNGCGCFLLPGTVFDSSIPCFRMGFGRFDFKKSLSVFDNYLTELFG